MPTKSTFGLRIVGFRWSIEPFVYRILAVRVLRIAIVYEAAEHFLGVRRESLGEERWWWRRRKNSERPSTAFLREIISAWCLV